ncbi:uncharacterized protein BDR25DRAFT_302344 [Lindgomyces ingoldianus]|uniref:Uncharacterized protein n=1 Tax=Lindgomyces ingoldianus TaxID=673940 RepID=A0ACB6R2G9_9PLEO|nr:uncharacterized protein BDR25DRAFT_302344 [Lindgomyces ingoldianus]KAF2473458.1 hypothetical protein BDR25DRAFT_302344 [Lindgomyces ingoldianus]
MLFNLVSSVLALYLSTLSHALPLDGPSKPQNHLVPRAKSYSIVNVDGGSTAAQEATTVIEETTKTKTVRVTDVAPTVTDKVTTVVVSTQPASTTSQSSSSSFSTWGEPFHLTPDPTSEAPETISSGPSSIPTISFAMASTPESPPLPPPTSSGNPTETGEPSIVTVVITATKAVPTEYYDNGLWHTSYPVKTFETVVTTVLNSTSTQIRTPTITALSTPSVLLPTLDASSASSYNHTQIPGRRRAWIL